MFPAHDSNSGRPEMGSHPFRRVLVGWDGSPGSVAALRMAAVLVGRQPGHVVAFAVLPPSARPEAERDETSSEATRMRNTREAFEFARAAIAASSGARITLHTEEGRHAARSLCEHGAQHGFDLLVVGRHGDGGLLHPRLGRVAEAVCRASTIPVLLLSAQ